MGPVYGLGSEIRHCDARRAGSNTSSVGVTADTRRSAPFGGPRARRAEPQDRRGAVDAGVRGRVAVASSAPAAAIAPSARNMAA
ncbi:hypothetical protein GCM10010533_28150 [Mycolicibacterium pallens]